jgi:sugar fermentation stimulation protein A
MQLGQRLQLATLIKRTVNFLTEVATPDNKHLLIHCPNPYLPKDCAILGTKLWYSAPEQAGNLPIWELAEVDDGYLVCVNPHVTKALFIEALCNQVVTELKQFNISNIQPINNQIYQQQQVWLENSQKQICFVALESIIQTNGAYLGQANTQKQSLLNLENAMQLAKEGHRAVIFNCVMHTGIQELSYQIFPKNQLALLQAALEAGVKILAYAVNIHYQELFISHTLPVILPAAAKATAISKRKA